MLFRSEAGRGSLALSTGVLTRSVPTSTWDGTTYNATSATALSFGNTAANIDIFLTNAVWGQSPALPFVQTSSGNSGWELFDTRSLWDPNAGTMPLTNGTKYYMPIELRIARPISGVAVDCSSIATTGNVRVSLYDWGTDGNPKNLLTEFTSSSQIGINTSTGTKSVTMGTPFFCPPGFYFVMVQADAAVVLRTARNYSHSGGGNSSQRDYIRFEKTGTYGAAPDPADTGLTGVSLSSGAKIGVMLK